MASEASYKSALVQRLSEQRDKEMKRGPYSDKEGLAQRDHAFYHEAYEVMKFLPPQVLGSHPKDEKIQAVFTFGTNGVGAYGADNAVEIPMSGYDFLTGLDIELTQAAITGLTTGKRLKNFWDGVNFLEILLNNTQIFYANGNSIASWIETHSTYEEYQGLTSTLNHYATAVTGAATYHITDPLKLLGLDKKPFPCGLLRGHLRININMKSLANNTTAASGTAADGAISNFRVVAHYVRNPVALKAMKEVMNLKNSNTPIKIPYFYMDYSPKIDSAASTSDSFDLDWCNGKHTKALLFSQVTDGTNSDSIVNKSTLVTDFNIRHNGVVFYPNSSINETIDMNHYYKRTHEQKCYPTGNKNVIRCEFNHRPHEYDPAILDGYHDFTTSANDGLVTLTKSAGTASDIYATAICHGMLEFYQDGSLKVVKN